MSETRNGNDIGDSVKFMLKRIRILESLPLDEPRHSKNEYSDSDFLEHDSEEEMNNTI